MNNVHMFGVWTKHQSNPNSKGVSDDSFEPLAEVAPHRVALAKKLYGGHEKLKWEKHFADWQMKHQD